MASWLSFTSPGEWRKTCTQHVFMIADHVTLTLVDSAALNSEGQRRLNVIRVQVQVLVQRGSLSVRSSAYLHRANTCMLKCQNSSLMLYSQLTYDWGHDCWVGDSTPVLYPCILTYPPCKRILRRGWAGILGILYAVGPPEKERPRKDDRKNNGSSITQM